jgi:hypothetical protein
VPERFLFNKPSDNSQRFDEKLFQITRGFFLDQRIFSKNNKIIGIPAILARKSRARFEYCEFGGRDKNLNYD